MYRAHSISQTHAVFFKHYAKQEREKEKVYSIHTLIISTLKLNESQFSATGSKIAKLT